MQVYFLRHGVAANRNDWKGDDAERPLTKDGIKKLKQTATMLAELDLGLDLIITSPLVRARDTADIVAKKLKPKPNLVEDQRLAPGFNADKLSVILAEHPNTNAVMVVGHEPDFSETIGALIGGGRVVCKKGGLALVDLPDANSRQGELLLLVPPKIFVAD